MKFTSVVLPITAGQRIDERYDAMLAVLNQHACTLHLLVVTDPLPIGDTLPPSLSQHSAQMQRLTMGLYHEALDAIIRKLGQRFFNLRFEVHIKQGDSVHAIQDLLKQVNGDLLLCDRKHKDRLTHGHDNNSLFYLLHRLAVPTLIIPETPRPLEGLVSIIDDALLQQPSTADQFVRFSQALATLLQGSLILEAAWRWQGEDFLRSWLNMNELDIARYAKTARQQFNSQLMSVVEDALALGAGDVSLRVVDQSRPQAETPMPHLLSLDSLSPLKDDTYQWIDQCNQPLFIAPYSALVDHELGASTVYPAQKQSLQK